MPRNPDGEFELVLGNKQLLSLFFLVVILFAVFFSLGYMVGTSVTPGPTQAAAPGTAAPSVSDAPPPRPGRQRAEEAPQPPPAVTETQPAQSQPASSAAGAPAETAAAPAAGVVAGRIHLQLAALRVREDAERLAEAVRQKGYHVVAGATSSDGFYRVLVGPFDDEKAAQQTRAQLEKDGYKSILKKP